MCICVWKANGWQFIKLVRHIYIHTSCWFFIVLRLSWQHKHQKNHTTVKNTVISMHSQNANWEAELFSLVHLHYYNPIPRKASSEKELLSAALGKLQISDQLMKNPSEKKVVERQHLKETIRTHSPAILLQLNEAQKISRYSLRMKYFQTF